MLFDPLISALEKLAYWYRSSALFAEGDREVIFANVDLRGERFGAATPPTAVVSDFLEAAQVVGGFLEVRYAIPGGGVPQRPEQRQEGSLPSAVVAHEQRQRRKTSGLPPAEATIALQRDPLPGHW